MGYIFLGNLTMILEIDESFLALTSHSFLDLSRELRWEISTPKFAKLVNESDWTIMLKQVGLVKMGE
jgi:hypothetical protein